MAKIDFDGALKKVGDAAKRATEKTGAAAKKAKEKAAATAAQIGAEKAAIEATGVTAISPQNAVKIFYYLMAIDRKIMPEEEEKFDLIGKEMDPDFEAYKEALVKECKNQMEKIVDVEDYYDVIQDGIEAALAGDQVSNHGFVTPKLLLWDLLTIAYGDDEYGEAERRLLKYVAQRLNIKKDIFLEMESSILTVRDIEKEITWIKGTDRKYLAIEKQVKELEKRRDDILFAVKALIML